MNNAKIFYVLESHDGRGSPLSLYLNVDFSKADHTMVHYFVKSDESLVIKLSLSGFIRVFKKTCGLIKIQMGF